VPAAEAAAERITVHEFYDRLLNAQASGSTVMFHPCDWHVAVTDTLEFR
jgi:hypothetical protein